MFLRRLSGFVFRLPVSRETPIRDFLRPLELVSDPKLLVDTIADHLMIITKAQDVHLYLRHLDGEDFRLVKTIGSQPNGRWTQFQNSDRLITWSIANEQILVFRDRPETMTRFPPEERDYLLNSRLELSIPFKTTNRLVGLALIGRHSSFRHREITRLMGLSAQISFALENAWLAEQQRVRQQKLYRAEKLAAVGELAAGAAHDKSNPLTAISSMAEMIESSIPKDNPTAVFPRKIIRAVGRINKTIEDLLAFARPSQVKKEQLDLNRILAETADLVSALARKSKIKTRLDLPIEGLHIYGDQDRLRQAFLNVVLNGIQAMPNGGELTVTLRSVTDSARLLQCRSRIDITDNGCGIPNENVERIFDPFFTTKPEGTGLGLSIVYGIIRGHRGEIVVKSEEGLGTTVTIEL